MFVYQPTFNTLDVKQANGKYNVSARKSKGIFNSILQLLHDFAPLIKYFAPKIGLQLNNRVLIVEQNNYVTKKCKLLHRL